MKNVGSLAGGIRLEGTCYMSREGERMCVFVFGRLVRSERVKSGCGWNFSEELE